MPRADVEAFVASIEGLGISGIAISLQEKNVPPEIKPCPSELRAHLGLLSFQDYEDFIGASGRHREPERLKSQSKSNWSRIGHRLGLVKIADKPFHPVDMEGVMKRHAETTDFDKKRKILERLGEDIDRSMQFIEVSDLLDKLEAGEIDGIPGVGKGTIYSDLVDLVNARIDAAVLEASGH